LTPGPEATSDDELTAYIKATHNTVYHPACTVMMGAENDPLAPLDPRLRVKGIAGLRVADGSVMPTLLAVNPALTTMVIGEKCVDLLRADAR
ncbi:MAG: GMC oxidoreductase, partial [Pseudonocardiaceae bacterium]